MTISEIAKLAGVSSSAVSRYLNEGSLSAAKKEKIRQVIEETGYKPSAFAQTLRTKKTNQVGIVIPKINSDSVSRVTAGIGNVLGDKGYLCIMGNTDNNMEKELQYLRMFRDKQTAGLIFVAGRITNAHKDILSGYKVPVIIVGQAVKNMSCVYYDDYGAAKELTKLMLNKGRRNIAYIGVDKSDISVGVQRLRGVEDALAQKGLVLDSDHKYLSLFSRESGYEAMKALLKKDSSIDGVFCATDNISAGAISCLKEYGKSIPKDISIVGVGDSTISDVISPKLTTAHFYYKTSGEEAARQLLLMMKDNNLPCRQIKLNYEIVQRESV